MKHLRKSILTLLALTLFGGAGAWAQEEVLLTTVTATGQTSSSQSPDGIVTVSLNGIGYYDGTWGWLHSGSVTVEAAQGYTITRCVFKQGSVHVADDLAPFTATIVGGFEPQVSAETSTGQAVNDNMDGITSIEVYGTAPAQEIELTPDATGKVWTLGQTPDYDLELQVEYYQPHTLDSIPLGWQVKVGNAAPVYPTAYTEGNTSLGYLAITETDSVELIPPAEVKPNVKNVTLVEPVAVQTVNIDGVELQIAEGETWRQIAQRNSGLITADDDDTGYVYRDLDTVLRVGTDYIFPTDTYNSSLEYYWFEH